MIPRSALAALDRSTPQINPLIANGLATTHMLKTESFVDDVMRIVAKGFPPELRYLGYVRCTPLEEYAEVSRTKSSKSTFDVARSDMYLVRFDFRFADEPVFSRYMYLPFVGQAGTIHISGSRYVISPVLADQVISVDLEFVFVRVLKAKLTFNRVSHRFKIDGVPESVGVVWAKIYNRKPNDAAPPTTTTAKPSTVHYLLAKYGLSEMFAFYTDCHPVVGGDEITREHFPQENWVLCESAHVVPRNFKAYYAPSNLRIAIPRSEWNANVENLVCGVFYVVDHFPDKIKPEYVDDPKLWQLLLGYIIWSDNIAAGKLINDVRDHFVSLDEYLDIGAAKKLKEIGYESRDVYHLFYHIVSSFDEWHLTAPDRVSTMYNKELSILPFVLYNLVSAINQLYFNIISAKKKDYVNSTQPSRSFNRPKIERLMNTNLRQGLAFKLVRDHGEVSTTGTSGDNMALKPTSLLVPQSKSTRSSSGRARVALNDPTKRLHASIAEVGGCWALPKSDPDGRARVNPCARIDENGLILRDMEAAPLLDAIQELIKQAGNSTKIASAAIASESE